jgi:hypothetical protein
MPEKRKYEQKYFDYGLHFLKSKKLILLLSILMLLSLALFLIGPKTMTEDFIESRQDEFTLEPFGNKTLDMPSSFDQIFYLVSARNLVLKNVVLVEINGSGALTLYTLDDNTTIKLAEHILFYDSNLSETGIMAKIIVKNEVNGYINVKTSLKRVLSIKIADFTVPHASFIIFIATLLSLQFLSQNTNGDTLIGSILSRIVFKLKPKNTDIQKTTITYGIVLEIFLPILLLCLSAYALMIHEQGLSSVKGIASYTKDCIAKIVLIGIVLGYFFAAVIDILYLAFRSIKIWILKNKGQEFLKMYEEFSRIHKAEAKIIFPLAFIFLAALATMIAYGFELKIILGTMFCLCLILYAITYYMEIKRWQVSIWSKSFKEFLVDFIEIDAKMIGFWVLGIIAMFATFTMMIPLFSAFTTNFLLEFYPSFIYELGQSYMLWVKDAFTLFGQLQAPICLVLIGPYWITRTMICKFEAKYKSRLFIDIAIFFIIFTVSEYLKWTYYFFTKNQPYDMTSLLISVVIGMAASILKDLLTEIHPR